MSDDARDDQQDTSPKSQRSFFPADMPSWLSAGANVGILLVGIVGVWTTVRISGLENYFRSELAVRNEQIVHAESRLRDLQLEAAAASQSIETLERQRGELATQNTALSESADFSQRQLAYNVFQSRVEGAQAGTSLSALESYYRYEWPRIYAEIANPGVDVLDRVLAAYANDGPANPYDVALKVQLRTRCFGVVQTPITFAAIEAALGDIERATYPANATLEQISASHQRAQEQIQAQYASRREYLDAVSERNRLSTQAATRAAEALQECGRLILDLPAR